MSTTLPFAARARTRFLAAGLAALALTGVAACGDDADDSTAATTAAEATGTTTATGTAGGSMGGSGAMAMPFGPACSAVPTTGEGSVSGMADDPVATAASNNPVLSTLVTAVTEAGLGDTLNSAEDITVFAPSNDAFAAMDKATMDAAMADPQGLLSTVLTYHVVPGRLAPDALAGTHETLQGDTLEVTGSGEAFTVNGSAKVVCGNVQTANATVYIIDSVLMPPSLMSGSSMGMPFGPACSAVPTTGEGSVSGMADDPVATAASNNPVLSSLVGAVQAAGLVDTLNSAEDITVFAPSNDAFAKLDAATMSAAMADPQGLLSTVLTYHVVPGRLAPEDLSGTLETLQGDSLVVAGSGEAFTVNGANAVVCGNVQTANATVYIIDGVLMPPAA